MSDDILKILNWLMENPAVGVLVAFILLLGLAVLASILIIALVQGREVSIRSLKIGARSAPKSDTLEDNVGGSPPNTEEDAATQAAEDAVACVNIAGLWDMRDWRHDYSYHHHSLEECKELEARDRRNKFCAEVELTQKRCLVEATFSHPDKSGNPVVYELEGKIRDRIFTGQWREVGDYSGRTKWFGAFQFVVEKVRTERTMVGRWVGIDSGESTINCGVWEWRERPGKGVPSTREWPSAESSLDFLRRSERSPRAFTEPKPVDPLLKKDYDKKFWEILKDFSKTKEEFIREGHDWNALLSPHKELCIWCHNEAIRILAEEKQEAE